MICVAWQLLSHQSYSFIVFITSFSMIKEYRPSRKEVVDERTERERERERERMTMREHSRIILRPSQETTNERTIAHADFKSNTLCVTRREYIR